MPLRLSEAEATRFGTRVKDARPRTKVRVPRPEFESGLDTQCRQQGVPLGIPCRFHPTRKWRFDRAWPDRKVAIEVDGAAFQKGGGRHTRGAGYRNDCRKLAEAAILGWRVLRVTTDMVQSGEAFELLRRLLGYPARER